MIIGKKTRSFFSVFLARTKRLAMDSCFRQPFKNDYASENLKTRVPAQAQ